MPDQEAIDALAEAWAVVNGDEQIFRRQLQGYGAGDTYIVDTYRDDADRAIEFIRSRGFDIVRKE